MYSSLIGKIEKANRYATETRRINISGIDVNFDGDNGPHQTGYRDGEWHCSCEYFSHNGLCAHTIALQKVLAPMLPEEAIQTLVI